MAQNRRGRSFPGSRARLALLRALCASLLLLCSCSEQPGTAYEPEYSISPPASRLRYIFAPHPLLNPQKLAEAYGGIIASVNRRLADDRIQLTLETSISYAAFNEKLKNRRVHFALPNPYQTLLAHERGYVVLGRADDGTDFRGVVLVRKNAGVASLEDLKGRRISLPAPTALAATMMPELYLKERGVDPRRDVIELFVGTHESALMNASIGASDAVCTWPPAWRMFQREHPEEAARLELRWQTDTLPGNGLVALAEVPEHVRAKVAQAFLQLHESAEGRRLLAEAGLMRFIPAERSTYAPVADFVRRYEQLVRPLRGLDE